VTTATGYSPFELNYGYRPNFTIPIEKATSFPAVDQRLQKLREARKEAESALRISKERMKEDYEKGKKKAHEFQEGDLVWLDSKAIKIKQPANKLGPKRLGPYPVSEKVGDQDYQLDLFASPGLKITGWSMWIDCRLGKAMKSMESDQSHHPRSKWKEKTSTKFNKSVIAEYTGRNCSTWFDGEDMVWNMTAGNQKAIWNMPRIP